MTFFWNKSSHPLQPCLFLDHRVLVEDLFIIFRFDTIIDIVWTQHCTTLPRDGQYGAEPSTEYFKCSRIGAPGSLCFITLQGCQDFSPPKFVWQFWLLIFNLSKKTWRLCHDLALPACSVWSPVCPASLSCRGTPSPSELHTPYPPETPVRAGKNVLQGGMND